MLQVRLELTTSASPAHILLYKYRALTDCATGACFLSALGAHSTEPRATAAPDPRDKRAGSRRTPGDPLFPALLSRGGPGRDTLIETLPSLPQAGLWSFLWASEDQHFPGVQGCSFQKPREKVEEKGPADCGSPSPWLQEGNDFCGRQGLFDWGMASPRTAWLVRDASYQIRTQRNRASPALAPRVSQHPLPFWRNYPPCCPESPGCASRFP